ncbi:MAG: glycoside hydrolase family 2 [Candidatus Omnitrophica bacterium]|nr:glycoside hydrolase family 2 [Candidatus Omnitrophota bacterium]
MNPGTRRFVASFFCSTALGAVRLAMAAATLSVLYPTVWGISQAEVVAPTASAVSTGASADTVFGQRKIVTAVIPLDGQNWLIAADPKNQGRDCHWDNAPATNAIPAKIPGVIQQAFPEYHGVAWYWLEFAAPPNPHANGHYLLRFHAVDYLAEAWVNGIRVGSHEGSEEPFTLDATGAIKPGVTNLLAVRVLNPTHELIDGIRMEEVAVGRRDYPYPRDNAYNTGGIIDSVELLMTPPVRIEDIHVIPDWKNGDVRIIATLRNAGPDPAQARFQATIAPGTGGNSLAMVACSQRVAPGDTEVKTMLHVPNHRLWQLDDPYLYRVTGSLRSDESTSVDERSVRCGFRDFRFTDGYFRLNGCRIRLQGPLYIVLHYPVTQSVPYDEDLMRRDVLNMKALGFNCVRFACGAALPARQLDVLDEMGLLACEEHFGARELASSPLMEQRWDRSLGGVIRRDRNHPCIVIWSLLNEVTDGRLFRHAARSLPLVRDLDESRMVLINSGRFDLGSNANPLSSLQVWRGPNGPEPLACYNNQNRPAIVADTTWPPGELSLHPGPKGEFSVARWTCPDMGEYSLTVAFRGLSTQPTTTDTHVLLDGKPLHVGFINVRARGNTDAFAAKLTLAKGDTLDFAVGFGNGNHGGDSTALSAAIQPASGKPFRAAPEFSSQANPNGAWSYGYFAPGPAPDSSTFKLYTEQNGADNGPVGTLSNPGSPNWETGLHDIHVYPTFPHTAAIINQMRHRDEKGPIILSEFGVCGAQDYPRFMRHFEQLGQESAPDARIYREKLDRFMADWQRWRLDECWARPEDYFTQSQQNQAKLALGDFNAWMSNPNIVGSFSSTQIIDAWFHGCGLTSYFRELKPGMADVFTDLASPVRWCLFVDPVNIYRGTKVRLEVSLVNLDALQPGTYPARLQVVGPRTTRVFEKDITIEIPPRDRKPEPPFAQSVFSGEVKIDGPSGKYRFLATFQHGAAAGGGETEFYVSDAAEMPPVTKEIVLWGHDPALADWLSARGIRVRNGLTESQVEREVILASGQPVEAGRTEAFKELARRMTRGSAVIFLTPESATDTRDAQKQSQPLRWLPVAGTAHASFGNTVNWYFRADPWAKEHPIFQGLPSGGIMDYTFYRDLLTSQVLVGLEGPLEAVCGAIQTSGGGDDYRSDLMLAAYRVCAGRCILNTLRIRENLGKVPAAERLLRNMLNYAAQGTSQPMADLPANLDEK